MNEVFSLPYFSELSFLPYILFVCFIPPIFFKLFLLSPKSLQKEKQESQRHGKMVKALRTIYRTGNVAWRQVVYTMVLGNEVGSHHSDASQMSPYQPHYISGLNGQVEVCGILLSSQVLHVLPTPNLGETEIMNKMKGTPLSCLLILLHYYSCIASVYCFRGVFSFHELYRLPGQKVSYAQISLSQ